MRTRLWRSAIPFVILPSRGHDVRAC